jgi:hypothetical protein
MKTSHSHPWIIWCRQRSGSISLFAAISTASEHPQAEIEPFDFGPIGDRQFTNVGKRMAPEDRDRSLREICDGKLVIKHCYENLSEGFNHALAEISTKAGYRHIHLVRRDELARLVSKGVAEQHGTWGAHEWTRERFAAYVASGKKLPPLDVPMLKSYHDQCEARWRSVGPLLAAFEVVSEEVFANPAPILSRVAVYLGMPESCGQTMAAHIGTPHGTRAIWELIPNTAELKGAIAA